MTVRFLFAALDLLRGRLVHTPLFLTEIGIETRHTRLLLHREHPLRDFLTRRMVRVCTVCSSEGGINKRMDACCFHKYYVYVGLSAEVAIRDRKKGRT